MNRRQAAQVEQWAAQDAAGNPVCGLCGKAALVFADPDDATGEGLAAFDVCGECNRAFRELAQALADAQDAREARLELVDQVAGQLELGDAEDEDEDQEDTLEDELGPLELGQLLQALHTGDWTDVPTMLLNDAVHVYADGFRKAELTAMRKVLAARA